MTYIIKQTTDTTPTVDQYSANNQWSTYLPSIGIYISRLICRLTYLSHYIGRVSVDRHIGQVSVNMSVNMSTDMSVKRPIYQLRCAQTTHDPKYLSSSSHLLIYEYSAPYYGWSSCTEVQHMRMLEP